MDVKMKEFLPESLIKLASVCQHSLYIVGGSVRDYLLGDPLPPSADWDLASPMTEEELLRGAERCGFSVRSVFKATGTVKLRDGEGAEYEFTRFRSDQYVRGLHAPSGISFTEDIAVDARRRDFCANAVYYDIGRKEFADPLGGIEDIKARKLRTVAPAEKVFGEDGLRLMRLARIAAQTGFSPDEECLAGAKMHAALIRDIVPERVFAEMKLLLHADEKRKDRDAPYRGLCLLKKTGVLKEILPELAAGEGMAQRADFHDHDVLEHSLRCVRYSPPEIRFAALFHDIGKPFCFLRDGAYHAHPEEGARITREVLTRWKAPKRLVEETSLLVKWHMRDYNLQMREGKLRRELVEYYPLLDKLLALKQADFSACKDSFETAPCVIKWQNVISKMRLEGAPLSLSELAVKGDDLLAAGVSERDVGRTLRALLLLAAENGALNRREKLLARVPLPPSALTED